MEGAACATIGEGFALPKTLRTKLIEIDAKQPDAAALDAAAEAIKAGKDINYEGATGSLEFDAAGDVSSVFVETEVRDGKVVEIGMAE